MGNSSDGTEVREDKGEVCWRQVNHISTTLATLQSCTKFENKKRSLPFPPKKTLKNLMKFKKEDSFSFFRERSYAENWRAHLCVAFFFSLLFSGIGNREQKKF